MVAVYTCKAHWMSTRDKFRSVPVTAIELLGTHLARCNSPGVFQVTCELLWVPLLIKNKFCYLLCLRLFIPKLFFNGSLLLLYIDKLFGYGGYFLVGLILHICHSIVAFHLDFLKVVGSFYFHSVLWIPQYVVLLSHWVHLSLQLFDLGVLLQKLLALLRKLSL